MLKWLQENQDNYEDVDVSKDLENAYRTKLLPLESRSHFHYFHSQQLENSVFNAKPQVMFVGQYSTGKTTFIKYLLEQPYPDMLIGQEPTTDKFVAIMHSQHENIIPGHALVSDKSRPFGPLVKYENAFLNRFQCSLVQSQLAKHMTIIDTPGVLSGEKQRLARGYNFLRVLQWFAERVDRIILVFDANTLDISDELKDIIELLQQYETKIRIVLNKADQMTQKELMNINGGLMWSLGKIMKTPEVPRVFVGSFWDHPWENLQNKNLFDSEEKALFEDIKSLPKDASLRKLNDLAKRAKLVQAHAYIMAEIYEQLPWLRWNTNKSYIIENLNNVYGQVLTKYKIPLSNMPNISEMKKRLYQFDFNKLQRLNKVLFTNVDKMFEDLSKILKNIPAEQKLIEDEINNGINLTLLTNENTNPFLKNTHSESRTGKLNFPPMARQQNANQIKLTNNENVFADLVCTAFLIAILGVTINYYCGWLKLIY